MRRARFVASALCALVCMSAVAIAWHASRPSLTAADARAFTQRALASANVADVRVHADSSAGTFVPSGGGETRPVWITRADVGAGTLQMSIDQQRGTILRLDDTNGSAYLLDDAQAKGLAGRHDYPSLDFRLRRNYFATFAGVLGASAAVSLSLLPIPLRSNP
jgi:hypothetical protein